MNKSRRIFIKQSGIILAGAALFPSFRLTASTLNKEKFAFQLFSVDRLMHLDAKAVLLSLNAIGYRYIEHSNYNNRKFYGYSPSDFKKLANDCGLDLLSGHTVLESAHWDKKKKTFTSHWQQTLEDASMAGQQYIISPWLDRNLWDKDFELKEFLDIFNRCGELCKRSGLTFGYHNHDFEFSHYLKGVRLYDIILQYTDPDVVTQQLDIANINQQDFCSMALFKAYPGRFKLMHIKNIKKSYERHEPYKTAALDDGILDLKTIINQARTVAGTINFIMDQQNPGEGTPLNYSRVDYDLMTQRDGIL